MRKLGVAHVPPNEQLLLTARDGSGWLAPRSCRIALDASQQNRGRWADNRYGLDDYRHQDMAVARALGASVAAPSDAVIQGVICRRPSSGPGGGGLLLVAAVERLTWVGGDVHLDPGRNDLVAASAVGCEERHAYLRVAAAAREARRSYRPFDTSTLGQLLAGKTIAMPPRRQVDATLKKAPKVAAPEAQQRDIFDIEVSEEM